MQPVSSSDLVAIIGLGYVGLPLAVAFGSVRPTLGFDINPQRIEELERGFDRTREISRDDIEEASELCLSSSNDDLSRARVFIVTVPTPVTESKAPDFVPLMRASELVGRHMARGSLVIFESTVYPGATEEICIPILERQSGLVFNEDFHVGYSPERINPGDTEHTLTNIVKVTAGSTPEAAEQVNNLYSQVISAGTHRASSIRVAEAAKVIENVQRDVNIALVNELAVLFHRLDIDTQEVLAAARTKWNFLDFTPGLVGGHCIGVDPYYLTHIAQRVGHHAELILAGRRQNDSMGAFVASRMIGLLLERGVNVVQARVLVLGLTFKENCPDLRNTKVTDVIDELKRHGINVDVVDPWVDQTEANLELGLELVEWKDLTARIYDGVIVAVPHDIFTKSFESLQELVGETGVIFDVKSALPLDIADARL